MLEKQAEIDVIIVGYGPVGATLANMMGLYGGKTLLFERDREIYPVPRAVHADDETLRTFQFIGLQEAIKPAFGTYDKREYFNAKGDIFFETYLSDERKYGYRTDIYFHQPTLEAVLRDGVARFEHVELYLGYEVYKIEQDETGVTVTARDLADGSEMSVRANYVVGCDGARSVVRKLMGMTLKDLKFDQPWLVVDVYLKEGVTAESAELPTCHRQYCNPRQPITFVPTNVKNHFRWEFMLLEGQSKEEIQRPEKVRELLSLVVDPDKVDVARAVVYTFHALVAQQWRVGRVFIAGDAAHQMPPFAGQGMCSGIRDVHNLSWKLMLVLANIASDTILDSYEEERVPHVTRMTRGSMLLGSLIQTRNPIRAMVRDLLFKTILRIPKLFSRLAHYTLRPPSLTSGLLGGEVRAAKGSLFIQPLVRTETGETLLLDEILDTGFAIIGKDQDPQAVINTASLNLGDALSITFVQVVALGNQPKDQKPGTRYIEDIEGKLTEWFQQNQAQFVIVRPDRYVFGAYTNKGISQAARELLGSLCTL